LAHKPHLFSRRLLRAVQDAYNVNDFAGEALDGVACWGVDVTDALRSEAV
jgi:hypothetical protein